MCTSCTLTACPECPFLPPEPLATLYLAFTSAESIPRLGDSPGRALHSSILPSPYGMEGLFPAHQEHPLVREVNLGLHLMP